LPESKTGDILEPRPEAMPEGRPAGDHAGGQAGRYLEGRSEAEVTAKAEAEAETAVRKEQPYQLIAVGRWFFCFQPFEKYRKTGKCKYYGQNRPWDEK